MSPSKSFITKALELKPSERFIIIEALIRSLDAPDPKIEKEWAQEARKRLKAYKTGKISAISFDDMFNKHTA